MLRMILAFLLVLALALAAAWLADQPGSVTLRIGGYEIATSLLVAGLALVLFAGLVVLIWLTYHWVVDAPALLGSFLRNRRRRRGFDALSRGMVAAASGDGAAAAREVAVVGRQLGDSSLALLLKVQTAQLQGDRAETRRIFHRMLERDDTVSLGLRGLFMIARAEGDAPAARAYAERAAALGPHIAWASEALFDLQAGEGDWQGALATLEARRRHRMIDRQKANRLAAVLRTARAQSTEDSDPTAALDDALEAHRLDPDFVPAATIAARLLAEKGEVGRAQRIVERTWRGSPHPELAAVYAHVRPGDSARERLARARSLAAREPESVEGPIAIARAALEARAFGEARAALAPLLEDRPSQRVCVLMAEIENAENGDRGRVREWLTRAVGAPRDPAWTADGFVSAEWRPISPVSGRIDAFEWRTPVEGSLPEMAGELLIAGSDRPVPPAEPPALEGGRAPLPGATPGATPGAAPDAIPDATAAGSARGAGDGPRPAARAATAATEPPQLPTSAAGGPAPSARRSDRRGEPQPDDGAGARAGDEPVIVLHQPDDPGVPGEEPEKPVAVGGAAGGAPDKAP